MKKNLKRYKISKESETYAISLVENPAIEIDYIYMAEQKPLVFNSDEKHMVIGPVLIPNKPIYRRYEDEEFEVLFESDVIEKMAFDFLSNRRTNAITLSHQDDASDIYVVESWIKMSDNDKSNDFGFDCPIGTWFCSMKVNDDETWDKVKNGELNGFSVESLVSLDEINFSKIDKDNMEVNENSLLEKIKNLFNDMFGKKEEKFEEQTETVTETVTDTVVEPSGNNVEEAVEPNNSIPSEDNVEEDKVITDEQKVAEDLKDNKVEELSNMVTDLNSKIESLMAEIDALKNENKKLSQQPSSKPVSVQGEKKSPLEIMEAIRNGSYFKK